MMRKREYSDVLYRILAFLCSVFLTLIFVAGITVFVLWLSLRPHRPNFTLSSFSIPGLTNQTGAIGLPVVFAVNDQNPNQKIGIYYDQIIAWVYYRDVLVASGISQSPFYQPYQNTTVISGTLQGVGPKTSDPVFPALASDIAGGSVGLKLSLKSTVRFKVKIWDTSQHHMHVECSFQLRGDGSALKDGYQNEKCTLYF